MSFRNTLLALLVLIGLGGYVYWVELPQAQKEEKKEKLVEFQPDDITEVTLTSPDREAVLIKTDGVWKLTKPIEADADEATVKTILSTLSSAEVRKGLEGDVTDFVPFGLDKPNTTVTMKAGAKTLPVIKIGKTTPVGSSAYAARGDEKKVLLTTSSVRAGVDKSLKDLRNKNILRFTDDKVRKIEIDSGGGAPLVLEKSGEDWKIVAPAAYAADATAVRAYLSTLRALRATDFPDGGDLAAYGLDAPKMTVDVDLDGGGEQKLLVGGSNEKKEVWVKTASSPEVYTVGEWVGRDLAKPLDDFRDKTLLVFDKDKVKSIEVSRKDAAGYTITRAADGTWTLENATGPVSQNELTQFVNDLVSLKGYAIAADNAADLRPWSLDPPSMAVKINGQDGNTIGTILLGQGEVDGKRQYVGSRAGSGTVMAVRDFAYVRLDKPMEAFAPKTAPSGGAAMAPGADEPEIEMRTLDDIEPH